jgi:hypothetical protein
MRCSGASKFLRLSISHRPCLHVTFHASANRHLSEIQELQALPPPLSRCYRSSILCSTTIYTPIPPQLTAKMFTLQRFVVSVLLIITVTFVLLRPDCTSRQGPQDHPQGLLRCQPWRRALGPHCDGSVRQDCAQDR